MVLDVEYIPNIQKYTNICDILISAVSITYLYLDKQMYLFIFLRKTNLITF